MLNQTVSYHLAFLEGLASFFTPCVLPLIPAYFTFITGFSLEELTENLDSKVRLKVIMSTLAYVCGFSSVFILMGASASYLGGYIFEYKEVILRVGGVIIILFGLHLTGIFRIKQLDFERRLHFKKKPMRFLGTFVVGMAFGAGWSPCIGPLLGSILVIASSQESVTQGMLLLGIYSAGLALPFIVISMFINFLLVFIRKTTRYIKYINAGAGALLIVVGGLLVSGKFFMLSGA